MRSRHTTDSGSPHHTDPQVRPLWEGLKARGIKVGILSNTIWSRDYHREVFARDGVLDLIDGDVYSSEIDHVKRTRRPSARACRAVGVSPRRRSMSGDRMFEDVHGPQQVGMRAIWIPHSDLPAAQRVQVTAVPDATAHELLRRVADRGWVDGVMDIDALAAPACRAGVCRPHRDAHRRGRRCGLPGRLGRRRRRWRRAGPAPRLAPCLPTATPAQLLATNKLGSIFGTTSATITYYRRVKPDLRTALPMAVAAYVGAIGGAFIGLHIPKSAFNPIILVLLVVVGAYTLFKPSLGTTTALRWDGFATPARRCSSGS